MDAMERRSFLRLCLGVPCAAAAAATITGCDAKGSSAGDSTTADSSTKSGPHLTVYLWQTILLQELVPYIREQLPDADIEFIVGNNNVDLYCYLQEHGALPDIITTRRFSARDARPLHGNLVDFSSYDIVSRYSPYALQYYKETDGDVRWLPIAGIPETTVANKTLLDAQGLSVPTNYAEYASLCSALAERGIKPYTVELAEDWAAHTLLQASALDCFDSLDGIEWRSAAESAKDKIAFDDELWGQIFHEAATFIADSHLDAQDAACEIGDARSAFISGKAAMFRGTPEVVDYLNEQMDDELVLLPYFSQTTDESWVYTYASMNVALARSLEEDEDKLDLALKVVDLMTSEEGQHHIAGGSGMASYMPGVPTTLADTVGIENEVQGSDFYIRYASNASFPASLAAVQGLVTGEMSEQQALEAFKTRLNDDAQEEDGTVEIGASFELAPSASGAREAASSILTTVRNARGAQAAIAPYYRFASPVFKGTCTRKQLSLMIAQDCEHPLGTVSLTGAELKKLIEAHLKKGPAGGPITRVDELPVASGMRLAFRKNDSGFELSGLKVAGAEVEDSKSYEVLLTYGLSEALDGVSPGTTPKTFDDEATLSEAWVEAMEKDPSPAQPEDYIEIER